MPKHYEKPSVELSKRLVKLMDKFAVMQHPMTKYTDRNFPDWAYPYRVVCFSYYFMIERDSDAHK